jgi:Spy/CpxP family protein refolding chaperone
MAKRTSILVFSMVALLMMGAYSAAYAAQDNPAASPSRIAQATGGPPQGPSEEMGGPGRHGHGFVEMLKKLGITDEQKSKIRELYVGFRDRTRKARMELMSFMDEKRTMMLSGKIDQAKLAQIDEQIVKLRSDVMRERLKLRRDRLGLLTQEQIGRIADWKAEKAFRSRIHKGHGGRMHDGD